MAERERCPGCGNELPANAPQGLCPACLLKQGMESEARILRRPRRRALPTPMQRRLFDRTLSRRVTTSASSPEPRCTTSAITSLSRNWAEAAWGLCTRPASSA